MNLASLVFNGIFLGVEGADEGILVPDLRIKEGEAEKVVRTWYEDDGIADADADADADVDADDGDGDGRMVGLRMFVRKSRTSTPTM